MAKLQGTTTTTTRKCGASGDDKAYAYLTGFEARCYAPAIATTIHRRREKGIHSADRQYLSAHSPLERT